MAQILIIPASLLCAMMVMNADSKTACLVIRTRLIPITKTDFDAEVGTESLFKAGRVGGSATLVAVMIRVDDLWMERGDGIGGFGDGHRVWLIHANKGQVYVGEGAHLGGVAGVAADENTPTTDGQHVAVARSKGMIGVIRGHGQDVEAEQIGRGAV